jgi:thiopurine S-methyltransferase
MKPTFWHERWETNQIGFHQPDVNQHLKRLWSGVTQDASGPVLVPLCGKSRDLLWFRELGHEVLGVELSPLAIQQFFKGEGITEDPTHYERGYVEITCADNIQLMCADFLNLMGYQMPLRPRFIYDRASLIALPESLREDYVSTLNRLTATGTRMLLLSLEYPTGEMNGPPFSVPPDELLSLYSDSWYVVDHEEFDILSESPKFQDRGLSRLIEHVVVMEKS